VSTFSFPGGYCLDTYHYLPIFSIEEAKETADINRLIPPYNPYAEVPDDAYPLHNIIPEAEWKALSTSAFTAANSNRERVALLPYSRSNWINQHLSLLFASSSLNKRSL
jgi:DNA-directed RNA polymerase I subunit RPA49